MNKHLCLRCNKEFLDKRRVALYCSHKCANEGTADSRKRRVNIKCEKCGSVFETTRGELRYRGKIRFCSIRCRVSGMVDLNKYREIKCSQCKKKITKLKCRIVRHRNSFCSVECKRKFEKKNPPRKARGFWYENGYKILYTKNGKGIKEHISVMEKQIGRKLKNNECVHHINSTRDDNRIENLCLMNRSSHLKLHRSLKK